MKLRVQLIIVVTLALPSFAALAEPQLNGFGQVIVGQTNERTSFETGYDDNLSFSPESLFGVQLTAPVAERLDATMQIVARGDEDYEPEVTWGYLRHVINPHWSVQLGRQRLAHYRYSDYLEVGLAYPFLRPPHTVYDSLIHNYDGVNLRANYSFGHWRFDPQFAFGAINSDLKVGDDDVDVRVDRLVGAVVELGYADWLDLRASYSAGSLTMDFPSLRPLLDALSATGQSAARDRFEPRDDRAYYMNLSAELRHKHHFLLAEYKKRGTADAFIGRGEGWYVSIGHRIGPWTPMATFGTTRNIGDDDAADVAHPAFAPALRAVAQSPSLSGKSSIAGLTVRYDFRVNVALKVDFSHIGRTGAPDDDTIAAGLVFAF